MTRAVSANSGPPRRTGTELGRPEVDKHTRSISKNAGRSARSAMSGASIAYLLFLTWCLLMSAACRRTAPPGRDERLSLGAGPEQYSARVVRTVEQDGRNESFESRISVSEQMIREDWAEQGEKRALVIRPDLGESYLLFLDKGEYVARGLDGGAQVPEGASAAPTHGSDFGSKPSTGDSSSPQVDPIAIEGDMSPGEAANVTDRALPDATIDNHPCKAFERRAILPDGTIEVTRTYRATDLSGMTIRTELESHGKGGHLRVITERRDVLTGVPNADFDLPAGFRRKKG